MSFTTNQVTQNGNTTAGWVISNVGVAEAVVVRPTSGGSGIKINSVTTRLNPTRYDVSVTVSGAGAMAFKFSGEEMD